MQRGTNDGCKLRVYCKSVSRYCENQELLFSWNILFSYLLDDEAIVPAWGDKDADLRQLQASGQMAPRQPSLGYMQDKGLELSAGIYVYDERRRCTNNISC